MISSRNKMWTGNRLSGQSRKNTGIKDRPAIGTWIAKMYVTAFLMLSKMRQPG